MTTETEMKKFEEALKKFSDEMVALYEALRKTSIALRELADRAKEARDE